MSLLKKVFCAALLAGSASSFGELPIPPAPTAFVTDHSGLLQTETRMKLNRFLHEQQQQTGHQLIVWIAPSLEGASLEEWTNQAFRRWGVGSKQKDDGVALFLFTQDRRARIEVGYGLEGELTDAQSGRILREVLFPSLRANEPDRGVVQAVQAIVAAIQGAAAPAERGMRGLALGLILIGLIGTLIMMALFRSGGGGSGGGPGARGTRGSRGSGGSWIGGGFGGGGYPGGGFGGGGGSSGGGGASGGW
jgi:uncharacterized protein